MGRPRMYTDEEYKERRRESSRKWRKKNRDYQNLHYHKNKEKIGAYVKERKNKLPEEEKELRKKKAVIDLRKRRRKMIEFLGGKCAHCGIDDFRVLQIDHINDDGGYDRRVLGIRSQVDVRKDVYKHGREKYQLLCANCHMIKTYHEEYDERLEVRL